MIINRVARRGSSRDAVSPPLATLRNQLATRPPTSKRYYSASRTICHFMCLPAELRNAVYILVIDQHPDQSTIIRVRTVHANSRRYWPTPLQPALSRTCRQVRQEVLSIFYGKRTFTIRARRLVKDHLLETWSRVMRPSLFHLRSIKFKLRSPSRGVEIDILVRTTDGGAIECEVDDHGREMCTCKFLRCARDVERGVIGLEVDSPLVRFLKAWDLPPPCQRSETYPQCGFCGRQNFHVSLSKDSEDGGGSVSDSDSSSGSEAGR